MIGRRPTPPEDRFWPHVAKGEGCWLWTGGLLSNGYAHIRLKHGRMGVHRFAYELLVGPIPAGLIVMHRCDVRHCVNPQHLQVGTTADNMADKARKGRAASGLRNGVHTHPERRVRGERVNTAKLTADAVRAIRVRHAAGEGPTRLSRAYGVGYDQIVKIVKRRDWAHVD